MSDDARTLFRQEALRHFMEGREPSVLPRFIRPRTFACLWILLALTLLAGLLVWTAKVPVYTSGLAIAREDQGQLRLFVLVPANAVAQLNVGQSVLIHWPGLLEPVRTQITGVDASPQSPAAARGRFGLSLESVPAAVAVATADADRAWQSIGRKLPAELHSGTTAPAEVETGTRRLISLVPGGLGTVSQAAAGERAG